MANFMAHRDEPEELDAETLAAIEEGLAQVERGEIRSEEDMTEFFRRRGALEHGGRAEAELGAIFEYLDQRNPKAAAAVSKPFESAFRVEEAALDRSAHETARNSLSHDHALSVQGILFGSRRDDFHRGHSRQPPRPLDGTTLR